MTIRSSAPARSWAQWAPSPSSTGREGFALREISHVALERRDMARTVGFYANVLSMPR
jgi:hypothetical protein